MLKEFTVGASHTISRNYQSIRVEASCTWSVPEDCNQFQLDKLKEEAQLELRRMLEETYRAQKTRKNGDEHSSETA